MTQQKTKPNLKRYIFTADITRGTCSIYVDAESKEEAFHKVNDGWWRLVKGSEEWECEIEDYKYPEGSLTDVEEIEDEQN